MAISEISVDELADLLPTGVRLIDVREPSEYDEQRVPGTTLIPLATVPERLDVFEGDGPTYVICRSGGRSMQACQFVDQQGFDAVNIAGGTMAWVMSGRAVESGAS